MYAKTTDGGLPRQRRLRHHGSAAFIFRSPAIDGSEDAASARFARRIDRRPHLARRLGRDEDGACSD
jgi:hypothetical protein